MCECMGEGGKLVEISSSVASFPSGDLPCSCELYNFTCLHQLVAIVSGRMPLSLVPQDIVAKSRTWFSIRQHK